MVNEAIEQIKDSTDWLINEPDESVGWIWATALLSSALDTYAKPNEREIVAQIAFQHWVEGKPTKTISDELCLSQTAVTTKLWRFRNKLRVLGQADLN